MNEAIIISVSTILSAIITAGAVWFYHRKATKTLEETIEYEKSKLQEHVIILIKDAGQNLIEVMEESFKLSLAPIMAVNSKAMSMIGGLGAKANQVKMVERQVMEAVNQNLPISPDMIEEFSPALAETLRKYPELMPKALEVYSKITGGGLPGLSQQGGKSSRRHLPEV